MMLFALPAISGLSVRAEHDEHRQMRKACGESAGTAIQRRIKGVIVLTIDRAVCPINAMGMTKALMEKVMVPRLRTIANGQTVVCATKTLGVRGAP